jgi:hypothetical protein
VLSQWELANLEEYLRSQGKLGKIIRNNDYEKNSKETKPVKER